jgi:hypothetical protein
LLGQGLFFLRSVLKASGVHVASNPKYNGPAFPELKRPVREGTNSPAFTVAVKNVQKFITACPHVFMALFLTTDWNSLILNLILNNFILN